ncbi:MAG: tRNA epoxyqueuosine(34) reductase QueG [Chloroflexi bacterium]|nr:tRNA epoxyqueuosine(34) reductase QueG [Chloroflexota bacterium]
MPHDVARNEVKLLAREMGFDAVAVASAGPLLRGDAAVARVRQGLMDGLPWFTEERARRASRPGELLPGARSVISVAMSYTAPAATRPESGLRGKVARYARGEDYHRVMKRRLKSLVEALERRAGRPVRARIFVDDGPMLDRAAAEAAGVGWFGKNTLIVTPGLGSWVFLGQAVTDLELEQDTPLRKSCGSCHICMDRCPTGAIVASYVVDNRRCISFLTIENRGPIPVELRPLVGDWVFGCDICQEVCPVNRKAAPTREAAFYVRNGGMSTLDLVGLLDMSEAEYQERFRGSAIKRARRVGLQRNACVALGNLRDPAAVPALTRALQHGEPLVRGHAAWALGRIGGGAARRALEQSLVREENIYVRQEIEAALGESAVAAVSSGRAPSAQRCEV